MSRQQKNNYSEIYTQRSMENLSSPDQLKDYLKVTGMPVWLVMISILVLLVGIIAWSASATFTSYITAEGSAKGGVITVTMSDDAFSHKDPIRIGDELSCRIGETDAELSVSGIDTKGDFIAVGNVSLPDGTYDVRIGYRQTKAIELLLN